MKFKIRTICYLLIVFLGLFFMLSSLIYTEYNYRYINSDYFSNNWLLKIDGTDINKIIDLPYSTKENTSENIISIEKQIPNEYIIDPYLRVGSSQQEINIYLDNTLIYNFNSMRAINNGKTGGSIWLLVKLPDDCFGKTLKIEFISTYNKLSGTLNVVKFGNKSVLLAELLLERFPDVLLALSLFIFSIIFLLVSIYYKKSHNIIFNGYYIALMFLLSSIWILVESQFFVFIFNNYSLMYFLEFISLFLFPIFLYKYIYLEYNLKNKKYILILYKIHFYLLLVLMLLQFMGLSPFYLSQWTFLIIFLITFCVCIFIILLELKREKKLKSLVNILIILFTSCILDIISYDIKSYKFNISFIYIGTILIEIYILLHILKEISKLKKIKNDNKLLNLQLDYQLKYYNNLNERNSNLKSYKHDMLNHLSTVYNLIDNNNIEDSKKYISSMINNFSKKRMSVIDTGNPILDSILSEKIEIAKKQNIQISQEIFINKNLKIDLLDCCIIFSNILDNAIEASSKVKNNKYIKIKLMSKGNMLICKISNSIDKNVKINKDFRTTKKDSYFHGIGLKNVKNTINKYEGELSITYDNFTFVTSFILFGV
ncbi:sensor histidine kinase [Clostridium nigeriense]|uniref:sensor histidine kinase n=1 Tax=Clostridium nigeriense TaxID=1805470 RepID=UPI003D34769B